MSLNEFQEKWNSYAVEFNYPYSLFEISIDNKILNIKLKGNKDIAFLCDIIEYDGEKILKSFNMIASGDGSPQSGANIFIAIGILNACFNPQEDVEFRNNIFRDLGLLEIKLGAQSAIVVNDFKHAVNFIEELGL